jgi:predicted RNA-binding Zn ribbon-like protein
LAVTNVRSKLDFEMARVPVIAEPPPATPPTKPAPGELEVLRTFVNTYDVEDGTDVIDTPDSLRDWLAARGLIARTEQLDDDDVRKARSVREALRSMMLANNGFEVDPHALETLNNAARSAEVVVAFGDSGTPQLSPVRPGFDGALGRLLGVALRSMADGTWKRLKACAAETCESAFYDASKNRSGTWCAMKSCGNRAKARNYRARHQHLRGS